jgi:hypothetical protein
MATEKPPGSRDQFLAHLQQFMDRTLKDLDKAVEAEDADEKEIVAVRSVLLKIGRLWKEALADACDDPRPVDSPVQEARNGSRTENREG